MSSEKSITGFPTSSVFLAFLRDFQTSFSAGPKTARALKRHHLPKTTTSKFQFARSLLHTTREKFSRPTFHTAPGKHAQETPYDRTTQSNGRQEKTPKKAPGARTVDDSLSLKFPCRRSFLAVDLSLPCFIHNLSNGHNLTSRHRWVAPGAARRLPEMVRCVRSHDILGVTLHRNSFG